MLPGTRRWKPSKCKQKEVVVWISNRCLGELAVSWACGRRPSFFPRDFARIVNALVCERAIWLPLRLTLLVVTFKKGAYVPGVPVQPVAIRFPYRSDIVHLGFFTPSMLISVQALQFLYTRCGPLNRVSVVETAVPGSSCRQKRLPRDSLLEHNSL